MIRVTVTKDGQLIQRKEIDGAEVIFGRERDADVQLFGPAVSRRHARLQRGLNGWQIADLGAANGVYVVRPNKEPQRVVIEDVTEADRILIEAFTVSFEITEGTHDAFDSIDDFNLDEDSLETKRTQFISMQEVLEGADLEKLKAEGSPLAKSLLAQAERARASTASNAKKSDGPSTLEMAQPKVSTVSSAPVAQKGTKWWAKMESSEGHLRVFDLVRPHVTIGASSQCDIALPLGPPLLLDADRVSGTINVTRTARWPFPRIKVDGQVVKSAILGDGDSLTVGKLEVTFYFSEPDS